MKLAPDSLTAGTAARTSTLSEVPVTIKDQLHAHPNSTRDKVTVSFTLPQTQPAKVKVYDSQGREIATVFQEEARAKQIYQVEWRAGKQTAGMYLLQLQTPTLRQQQKLLLTK